MPGAWIIDAVPTPRGKAKKATGALSGIHPQELLAQCLNALVERNGFDPCDVDDLIAGCVSAAMGVISGQQDLVIGGGVESMSRVPLGSDRAGMSGHNAHLQELHPMVPQGISADLIASLEGMSRKEIDAFAAESQRRCAEAQKAGRFDAGLISVRELGGRPRQGEPEWRRDRTRSSARRHRRHADRNRARRMGAAGSRDGGLVTLCIGGDMGISTIIERS